MWWFWAATSSIGLVCWLYRDFQHSMYTQVPVEGIWAASALVIAATYRPCDDPLHLILGICLATLQRYMMHRMFHLAWWRRRHESNHNHARRRKLNGAPNLTSLAEAAIGSLSTLLMPISHDMWLGLLLEHVVEERVRTHILLGTSSRYGRWPPAIRKFWSNLETTYWVHVMVDSRSNMCFACPFWDRLFGTYFFTPYSYTFEAAYSWWWWLPRSLPLPLWDSAVGQDLQRFRVLADRAFEAFAKAPDMWRQSIPRVPL